MYTYIHPHPRRICSCFHQLWELKFLSRFLEVISHFFEKIEQILIFFFRLGRKEEIGGQMPVRKCDEKFQNTELIEILDKVHLPIVIFLIVNPFSLAQIISHFVLLFTSSRNIHISHTSETFLITYLRWRKFLVGTFPLFHYS